MPSATTPPFPLPQLFYFGEDFNVLVNCTSTFLGGLVQFVVPALLFLYFLGRTPHGGARVAGIRHARCHVFAQPLHPPLSPLPPQAAPYAA